MIEWNGRRAVRAGHLRDLLYDCEGSAAADQAARLIEAARLLCEPDDVVSVKAMIACGAYESAACVVLGPDRPFLVSRGATGVCLASTLIASIGPAMEGDEATGGAATPALAMLAALAAALLAEESRTEARSRPAAAPVPARLH